MTFPEFSLHRPGLALALRELVSDPDGTLVEAVWDGDARFLASDGGGSWVLRSGRWFPAG